MTTPLGTYVMHRAKRERTGAHIERRDLVREIDDVTCGAISRITARTTPANSSVLP